jgi:ferredoxin-2, mitochondrial
LKKMLRHGTKRLCTFSSSSSSFKLMRINSNLSAIARTSRGHCDSAIAPDAKDVSITFVYSKDGSERVCIAKEGMNIVQLAHKFEVDLEGACECSLACSTCHVILESEVYNHLSPPTEEEEDLLDLAFGLTSTSRLGCQVHIDKSMDKCKVIIPSATRNFYVDGHKPKPH